MATKVGEAYYELTAKNAKLRGKLKESDKMTTSWTKKMSGMMAKFGRVAFAGAIAGITALTASMVKATQMAAEEMRQTQALWHQLRLLGEATQENRKEIEDLANAMQEYTRYGDTTTRKMLQRMFALTGDYTGSMKNLILAYDMAESGLFDVNAAVRYVSLAMQGNIEILGRYIAELKSTVSPQIKLMNAQEKGAFAMDILQKKFGGLAYAVGQTAATAWDRFTNAVSDAWEALGRGNLKVVNKELGALTAELKRAEPEIEILGGVLADVGSAFAGFARHVIRGAGIIGEKMGEFREMNREYLQEFEEFTGEVKKGYWKTEEMRERAIAGSRKFADERKRLLAEQAKAVEDATDREIGAAKRALYEKRKIWQEEQLEFLRTRKSMEDWMGRFLKQVQEERTLQLKVASAREMARKAGEHALERATRAVEESERKAIAKSVEKLLGTVKLPEIPLPAFKFKLDEIDISLPEALKGRPSEEVHEPQWVQARQLWERSMTARGKTEDEKHTSQFDSMIDLLGDLVEVTQEDRPAVMVP